MSFLSRKIRDSLNNLINPATENKQDDIIIGLNSVDIEKNIGTISTNNSTTSLLEIDETFTGLADDIKDFAAINIVVWADQDSAVDGLKAQWSQDGINWDEELHITIDKNKVESYEFGVRAKYFRIIYINGGIAQGAFRLQVIYHPVRTRRGSRCLCEDIDPKEFAITRRSVLAAKKPNGIYTNIHATAGGNLKVAVEENETIFPIGSGVNGIVTLTSSATAYAIPTTASTKNHNIILYNGSDTTIFIGYQNTNANGIPILAGKTMEFKLGINQQLYGYCASSGKIMTYSYKELT